MISLKDRLKDNNFDLLRLILAGIVCLGHSVELSGFKKLQVIELFMSSGVAVKAFFVISGFLIFMSYERSTSLKSYAKKRLKRIYPAYFTIIALCAFGLVFVSTKSPAEYFSIEWLKYVAANLVFLNTAHPSLPGVFDANRMTAVNGSLWTIKIEVMFYIAVPMFVYLFRKFNRTAIIATVYVLSVIYFQGLTLMAEHTGSALYANLAKQIPGQLSYFMSGALLYYYLPEFERCRFFILPIAAIVLAIDNLYPLPLFFPLALACAVIYFALFMFLGHFGKYGDFSYGAYIAHHPIIQVFLCLGLFNDKPWMFLAAVIAATAIGAFLMWNLVEKRFLHSAPVQDPKPQLA